MRTRNPVPWPVRRRVAVPGIAQPRISKSDQHPIIRTMKVRHVFWECAAALVPVTEVTPAKIINARLGATESSRCRHGRFLRPACMCYELVANGRHRQRNGLGAQVRICTHFMCWVRAGLFVSLWRAGVTELHADKACDSQCA